jgi:hypothetical protein
MFEATFDAPRRPAAAGDGFRRRIGPLNRAMTASIFRIAVR